MCSLIACYLSVESLENEQSGATSQFIGSVLFKKSTHGWYLSDPYVHVVWCHLREGDIDYLCVEEMSQCVPLHKHMLTT